MTPQTTEHKPTRLTPQDLLLSELPGLLSLWKHDRNRETFEPWTALDLVVAWSSLQRLVLANPPSQYWQPLEKVIRDDVSLLLEAVLSHEFDCESWQRQVERLDDDWDAGREEAEELEWRTREAFDALDRAELLAWFAAAHKPSEARVQAWLGPMREGCEGAERFLADRPDLFLCLATDLAAVVASSRPELEETDPLLLETLGKHRRIEEMRDALEWVLSPTALFASVPRRGPSMDRILLELAAEGIGQVVVGCAAALGPIGAVAGPVIGHAVEKAINFFGPKIVKKWLGWLRGRPKTEQVEAVASLGTLSVEQARKVGSEALDRVAPTASAEDKALALEYMAAIPATVQQSLVLDFRTGEMTVLPSLSLVSQQSLEQLLPTNVPPYAAPTQLPGTPYFLKRVVGSGGFGVVYEAESPLQHLPLAIKFCLDPSMLDTLKRERDNLEGLMASAKERWSPRIVRLYGCDLTHATPFLVYEFVSGGNLTTYLAKRREETGRNMGSKEVLGLILQITKALAFAHKRGFVHRDLKPANVLCDGERLKLADFGIGGIVAGYAATHSQIGKSVIGRLKADEQVSLLQGAGTPLYMDPEQRRGSDPDPKHDLYSLGVVWYQLLVGDVTRELPHGWEDELASDFKVPRKHIALIKRCVGRIKNRPDNAGELLKLLDPVPPPPPAEPGKIGTVTVPKQETTPVRPPPPRPSSPLPPQPPPDALPWPPNAAAVFAKTRKGSVRDWIHHQLGRVPRTPKEIADACIAAMLAARFQPPQGGDPSTPLGENPVSRVQTYLKKRLANIPAWLGRKDGKFYLLG